MTAARVAWLTAGTFNPAPHRAFSPGSDVDSTRMHVVNELRLLGRQLCEWGFQQDSMAFSSSPVIIGSHTYSRPLTAPATQ